MSIHKVRTLNIFDFYTPFPPKFAWIPFWWPFSQQCAYVFFYSPIPKKTLRKLLFPCLRKGYLLTGQCVKHNVWSGTYFWPLAGTIIFTMVKLKRRSKMYSHRYFSKYLPNNSRTPSKCYNSYAKTLFCRVILHSHFQSHSLSENIFKWS